MLSKKIYKLPNIVFVEIPQNIWVFFHAVLLHESSLDSNTYPKNSLVSTIDKTENPKNRLYLVQFREIDNLIRSLEVASVNLYKPR